MIEQIFTSDNVPKAMTTASWETLMEEPTLPETVEELQARLGEERVRRQRFYDEIRDEKVEFINGKIIAHSPAKDRHREVRDNIHDLLRHFVRLNDLGIIRGEKALCVFPRNDYEPDICFFGRDKAAQFTPDTLKFPIPDFICEVLSDTTESKDRGIKFQDYEAHAVQEYWIVDPVNEVLEQYVLEQDDYQLRLKSGSGEVESVAVECFCIGIRAIFDSDANTLLLREILATSSK